MLAASTLISVLTINGCGDANSAPTILTNPSNQTVTAGSAASFTAAANGVPTPTAQWQASTDGGATFSNVSGATSTTLSFTATSGQNGNQYRAMFTNSVGSLNSSAATLTVNVAPAITSNPSSQSVTAGNTAAFTASASGTPAPTVQWQVSTDGGATFSDVSGATSTTLSFTATNGQNGNQYRAVFTNTAGTMTTSAATLTVTPAVPAPTISSLSPNTYIAGSADFTLTVNGTNYTSNSVVNFDSSPLATTFVNSSQLTATVPKAAIATAHTVPVTVVDGALTSSPATFQITPDPFPLAFSSGDVNYNPAVDGQGRFVAYQAQAVKGIPPFNVYLRDTCVGAPWGCTPSSTLVSVDPSGTQCSIAGGQGSYFPSISGDGRFITFLTDSCFPGSTSANRQIALRDTCNADAGLVSGCTPSTTLISVNTSGQISTGASNAATISRNGRYVVWPSIASDLVGGVTSNGYSQVYLRDTCNSSSGPISGCTPHTIAVTTNGDWSSGAARFPAVSNNGIVVFDSGADNLVVNPGLTIPGSFSLVYRADCTAGVNPCALSIVTIAPGSGALIPGDSQTISANGRYIAFRSTGEDGSGHTLVLPSQLPPNFPPSNVQMPPSSAIIYDSCVDANGPVSGCVTSFLYASVDNGGNLDLTLGARAENPSLSDDGRFVAFRASLNLSPSYPGSGAFEVYVRDTCGGSNPPSSCTPTTTMVSVDGAGMAAGTVDLFPRISGDGHFAVFDILNQFPSNTSTLLPVGDIIMVRSTY